MPPCAIRLGALKLVTIRILSGQQRTRREEQAELREMKEQRRRTSIVTDSKRQAASFQTRRAHSRKKLGARTNSAQTTKWDSKAVVAATQVATGISSST